MKVFGEARCVNVSRRSRHADSRVHPPPPVRICATTSPGRREDRGGHTYTTQTLKHSKNQCVHRGSFALISSGACDSKCFQTNQKQIKGSKFSRRRKEPLSHYLQCSHGPKASTVGKQVGHQACYLLFSADFETGCNGSRWTAARACTSGQPRPA